MHLLNCAAQLQPYRPFFPTNASHKTHLVLGPRVVARNKAPSVVALAMQQQPEGNDKAYGYEQYQTSANFAADARMQAKPQKGPSPMENRRVQIAPALELEKAAGSN
jgi:hypothetical protein